MEEIKKELKNIIQRHMEDFSDGENKAKRFNLLNAISELDARIRTHEGRIEKLEGAMQFIAGEYEEQMTNKKLITTLDASTITNINKGTF